MKFSIAPQATRLVPTAVAILVGAIVSGGCASTPELTSSWPDQTIVVDGQSTEWTSNINYLTDAHLSLGVKNDADYVYVCVMSSEQQFSRQIMGLGLTVWFERDDGGKLGVHYPIGMANERERHSPDEEEDNSDPAMQRDRRFDAALDKLEILGKDDRDRQSFSTVDATGISVKIGSSNGSTVYELKVPLKLTADHHFAVDVAPGGVVKLGLQTGTFEGRRGEGGGGMRMGGRRGGGGGRMGYGGGEREVTRENRSRSEPIDFWAKIHLSQPSAGASN